MIIIVILEFCDCRFTGSDKISVFYLLSILRVLIGEFYSALGPYIVIE